MWYEMGQKHPVQCNEEPFLVMRLRESAQGYCLQLSGRICKDLQSRPVQAKRLRAGSHLPAASYAHSIVRLDPGAFCIDARF
jgi:hypothetical protein